MAADRAGPLVHDDIRLTRSPWQRQGLEFKENAIEAAHERTYADVDFLRIIGPLLSCLQRSCFVA